MITILSTVVSILGFRLRRRASLELELIIPGITTSEITMSKAPSAKNGQRLLRVRNARCIEAPRLERADKLPRLGLTVFDDKDAGHYAAASHL
jgi:hypothetical protein